MCLSHIPLTGELRVCLSHTPLTWDRAKSVTSHTPLTGELRVYRSHAPLTWELRVCLSHTPLTGELRVYLSHTPLTWVLRVCLSHTLLTGELRVYLSHTPLTWVLRVCLSHTPLTGELRVCLSHTLLTGELRVCLSHTPLTWARAHTSPLWKKFWESAMSNTGKMAALTCCWWSPWLLLPAPRTHEHGRRKRHRCSYWQSRGSSWTQRTPRAEPAAERDWRLTEGFAPSPRSASHALCKCSPAPGKASGSPCLAALSCPGLVMQKERNVRGLSSNKNERWVYGRYTGSLQNFSHFKLSMSKSACTGMIHSAV